MIIRLSLTLTMMLMCFKPFCLGEESFKKNGAWGTIKADLYTVTLFKNGEFEVKVKNTLKFKAAFIQRWKHQQNFPQIKFLRTDLKNNDNKTIEATYKYLWNGGTVEETLKFDCRSISVSYSFLPWIEKDTRWLTCLLTMRMPEKKEMKLIALYRRNPNGALEMLGKWTRMSSYFRIVSVRNAGPCVVDFVAEGKAWINILNFPNMAVIKNAKKRIWDNTVYRKNEKYKVEYLIYISMKNKTIKDSSIKFERSVPKRYR